MPYKLFEAHGVIMGGGWNRGKCHSELCLFDLLCACDESKEFESGHVSCRIKILGVLFQVIGLLILLFSFADAATIFHITTTFTVNESIRCLSWTPGGRRLLTGNQEGEFTLWDGVNFSFELIMSAHDTSFRSMAWSHNQNYLLTSDSGGNIKYWSPSIAPVQSLDSHDGQAIHGLSFSPSDTKFVSCGDDATVRVFDWAGHREERKLEGHGWDVKTVAWHPRSSVICSGSKDNLVKVSLLDFIENVMRRCR